MSRFTDILRRITARGLQAVTQAQQRTWGWFLNRARGLGTSTAGANTGPTSNTSSSNTTPGTPPPPPPRGITPADILGERNPPNLRFRIGCMIFYKYDPKYKITLPYYDIYPLVFPIHIYSNGFLGINMHYLPPLYRARLMDALYDFADINTDDPSGIEEILRITYGILNNSARHRAFRPCVKRYLWNHIRSDIRIIPSAEWDIALFLPLAQWAKESEATVWRDSLNAI